MNYLTTIHYNDFEFKLSYELDGVFKDDIYVALDQVEDQLHGLPAELEDYEDQILEDIIENWGHIIEDLRAMAEAEYDSYVNEVKNVYN